MKKLLFFFMLLPVFCLAQTNTTPQFKRNIPADSLLGYSIPGVTGNHWLPDTAWVKKHVGASGSFLPLTFTSNQTVTQNGFGVLFRAVASGDSSAVVNTQVGFGAATYALSFGTNGFLTTKTTGAAMGANLSGSNRALHINTTGGFYQDSIGHKGIDYGAEIDSTTWSDMTLITRRFFFDHLPSGGGTWGSITGTLSSQTDLQTALNAKQATLVSGTNIKTINSASLLGGSDILLQTPLVAGTDYLAPNGSAALLTSFPTLNQNTTGSSAKWTTARNLAGNSVDGSANVAFANKFIVQGTSDAGLSAAQFLGSLATGIVKNTTTTGVLSIAAPGTDYTSPTGVENLSNKTLLPANIAQTPTGTAGTDSVVVKIGSTKKFGAVAASAFGSGVNTVTSNNSGLPSISGSTLNIPPYGPGIWAPKGVIMRPDYTADQFALLEPSAIYETVTPFILTNTTGPIYRCWYTSGGSAPNIEYAESLDGYNWVRSTTNCVTGHARSNVIKVSGTYYCFTVPVPNSWQVDVYSSSTGNPGTWTLLTANIISRGSGGAWNSQSINNNSEYFDGTTWYMLLEGNTTTGSFMNSIGLYTASTPGGTWTANGGNPIINTSGFGWGGPDIHKVGSTFYVYVHGSNSTSSVVPTDIYRFHGSSLSSLSIDNGGAPVYARTQADEGFGTSVGQVADPYLIDNGTQTFMLMDANPNGNAVNSTNPSNLKLAVANYTLTNLVATNEGNASYTSTLSNPPFYDKIVSDSKYFINQTAVQAGTFVLNTGYFQIQAVGDASHRAYIDQDQFYLGRTGGVANIFTGNSSGMILNSWGPIAFNNGSGTGASSLGTVSNAGLWALPSLKLSTTLPAEDGSAMVFVARHTAGDMIGIASASVVRDLYTNTTTNTLTNSTSATSIIPTGTGTVNLGGLIIATVGEQIRVKFGGVYSTTGTPTLTIVLSVGGNTMATAVLSGLGSSVTNQLITGEAIMTITGISTSGAGIVEGHITYGTADNIAALTTALNNGGATTSVSNLWNFPAACGLTGQWSAASTSNTLKITQFSIEIIN